LLAAQVTHQRMAQQVAWCNEDLPFFIAIGSGAAGEKWASKIGRTAFGGVKMKI